MSKSKIQSYLVLMLLVFAGQSIAMPLMNCCVEAENTSSESQAMSSHHDQHQLDMSAHHAEIAVNEHAHADEADCNYQCAVCLGTVLLGEFTAFTTQTASSQLIETYHFFLPVSLTDNPFRPPIFA